MARAPSALGVDPPDRGVPDKRVRRATGRQLGYRTLSSDPLFHPPVRGAADVGDRAVPSATCRLSRRPRGQAACSDYARRRSMATVAGLHHARSSRGAAGRWLQGGARRVQHRRRSASISRTFPSRPASRRRAHRAGRGTGGLMTQDRRSGRGAMVSRRCGYGLNRLRACRRVPIDSGASSTGGASRQARRLERATRGRAVGLSRQHRRRTLPTC